MKYPLHRFLALTCALWSCADTGWAQKSEQDSIQCLILALDSVLFQEGFNHCNIHVFEQLTSEDFEFYHDKSGQQHKKDFLRALQVGLCADVKNYQSTRVLDAQFNEVHLLYNNGLLYGVLQTGRHSFYENIPGQIPRYASTAQFSHYWELTADSWKLRRAFSFDHKDPSQK